MSYCIVCGTNSTTKACSYCLAFWERARDKYADGKAGRGPKVDFTDDWDRSKGIILSEEEQKKRFALHISNLWEKTKGNCFYTGYTMFKADSTTTGLTDIQKLQNFSVDRKDGGIYESGSIVLSMNLINTMKNIFNQDDFDIICFEIVKHRIKERTDMVNMIGRLYVNETSKQTEDIEELVAKTKKSRKIKLRLFITKFINRFKR